MVGRITQRHVVQIIKTWVNISKFEKPARNATYLRFNREKKNTKECKKWQGDTYNNKIRNQRNQHNSIIEGRSYVEVVKHPAPQQQRIWNKKENRRGGSNNNKYIRLSLTVNIWKYSGHNQVSPVSLKR